MLLSWLFACAPDAPPRAPDVILVTWDTVRADRIGPHTPTFLRLAAEGTRFTTARSVATTTLPSHASLVTGLYPAHHGARVNGLFTLDPGAPTLAEALGHGGWATGAFVSAAVLKRGTGLERGFATYDDRAERAHDGRYMAERSGAATVDAALAWVATVPEAVPAFLWVHLFDAHRPWTASGACAAGHVDAYEAEIACVDAETGRLLDGLGALGRLDRAVVAVTADHGESLGEHGEWTHGYFAYDATARVPLVVWRSPALAAGGPRVLDTPISTVDVPTTLADYAGVRLAGDGRSLRPAVEGGGPPDARPIHIETLEPAWRYGTTPVHATVVDGQAWIDVPLPERYDLGADPDQVQNLWTEGDRGRAAALVGARPAPTHEAAPVAADAATLAQLEALGYAAPVAPAAEASAETDPKSRVRIATLVQSGAGGLVPAEALAEAEALRARFGEVPSLRDLEVDLLDLLGRVADADDRLAASPDAAAAAELAARRERRAGDERLAAGIRSALEADPGHPDARYDLATVLQRLGDHAAARVLFVEQLDRRPDDVGARRALARLLVADGALAEALATWDAAPALDDDTRCERARVAVLGGVADPDGLARCVAAGVELYGREADAARP